MNMFACILFTSMLRLCRLLYAAPRLTRFIVCARMFGAPTFVVPHVGMLSIWALFHNCAVAMSPVVVK